MDLFDRVFRQPCSKTLTPEENLATEITAYLLDKYEPFRALFLGHAMLRAKGATGRFAHRCRS